MLSGGTIAIYYSFTLYSVTIWCLFPSLLWNFSGSFKIYVLLLPIDIFLSSLTGSLSSHKNSLPLYLKFPSNLASPIPSSHSLILSCHFLHFGTSVLRILQVWVRPSFLSTRSSVPRPFDTINELMASQCVCTTLTSSELQTLHLTASLTSLWMSHAQGGTLLKKIIVNFSTTVDIY